MFHQLYIDGEIIIIIIIIIFIVVIITVIFTDRVGIFPPTLQSSSTLNNMLHRPFQITHTFQ